MTGEQPSGVPSPRVSWGCQKPVRSSQLYLVDLAGSERARTGGGADAEAELVSLREGNAINRSLLTLGTVIHRLAEGGGWMTHLSALAIGLAPAHRTVVHLLWMQARSTSRTGTRC